MKREAHSNTAGFAESRGAYDAAALPCESTVTRGQFMHPKNMIANKFLL